MCPETLPVNGFLGAFVCEFAEDESPAMQRLKSKTKTKRRRPLIKRIRKNQSTRRLR
jgi:hypothetical protein